MIGAAPAPTPLPLPVPAGPGGPCGPVFSPVEIVTLTSPLVYAEHRTRISVNPFTLYVVVPAAESVAAVTHDWPPLFDSSISNVAENVPARLIVVVEALFGSTLSHTQLNEEAQFEEVAEIFPCTDGAATWAAAISGVKSASANISSRLMAMGRIL